MCSGVEGAAAPCSPAATLSVDTAHEADNRARPLLGGGVMAVHDAVGLWSSFISASWRLLALDRVEVVAWPEVMSVASARHDLDARRSK
jgi:hypothetical protein